MSKGRSPGYPAIGLKEAVDKVRMVWTKDWQNKVPKEVIATHMGYKGLNGGSLPILAALNQYGLLEGRGDETRVSDRALRILAHEPGIADRLEALRDASVSPELFNDLQKKFHGGNASDAAVRSYLLINKFLPAAADTVIRSYRETIDLLNAEKDAYNRANPEAAFQVEMAEMEEAAMESGQHPLTRPISPMPRKEEPATREGMRKEVITLDEGDVVITFPENLSADSFGDLKDHLDLFVKKMQRRAVPEKH